MVLVLCYFFLRLFLVLCYFFLRLFLVRYSLFLIRPGLVPDHNTQALIHRKVGPHPVEEDKDFVFYSEDRLEVYKQPE